MSKRATPSPTASDLLRAGVWSVEQAAALLDVPAVFVERWCRLRLLPGALFERGLWRIPGPALSFFCGSRVEPLLSIETAARLVDVSPATLRDWCKAGRLKTVKLGGAKSSPVRIPESSLAALINGKRKEGDA